MKIFLIFLSAITLILGGQVFFKEVVRSMWSTSGHQQGSLYIYEIISVLVLIVLTVMYYRMELLQKNPLAVGIVAVLVVIVTQYYVYFK
jgi:hypothetical protein